MTERTPRRPLSLAAYLALSRSASRADKAEAATQAAPLPRPGGPLIWIQADTRARTRALCALCERLRLQRPEVNVLVTSPEAPAGTIPAARPVDTLAGAEKFIEHWRPLAGLWAGHELHPTLIAAASERGCEMILLDAQDEGWTTPSLRWLPDAVPGTLNLFRRIYTISTQANRRLRRMGIPEARLRRRGPLIEAPIPPDCSDALHEEVASLLAARPTWLAAHLRSDEVEPILRAHRRAARLAHRLLLIAVPASPGGRDEITRSAEAMGLRIGSLDDGGIIDENTQVLISDGPDEIGLWYRLAPLSFLGGSLVSGYGGEDPLPAAALGTALLYGPNVGRHLDAYSRLAEAGAARIVRDVDTLSAAVSHLVAPDRAAAMAHSGWDVISSGAALTDEVIEHLSDLCDGPGAR